MVLVHYCRIYSFELFPFVSLQLLCSTCEEMDMSGLTVARSYIIAQ